MVDKIRSGLKQHVAGLFDSDVRYQRSNYYYFLGKIDKWGSTDTPVIENIESGKDEISIRSNTIFMKKIGANDISLVTKRYDWSIGTIYTQWDHTKDMSSSNFYCVTDDNIVYKCLDNNGGIPVTDKPKDKTFQVFRTLDGYLWKYMYTIPTFKQSRFSSLDFIPIQKSLSNSFYNNGSIDAVTIPSRGSGYLDSPMTHVVISNESLTGDGAAANITVGPNGIITGGAIISGGSGYTKGVSLVISSATGYGAEISPIISGGVITGFDVVSGGFGYIGDTPIEFNVGGAELVLSISRVTGSITKVNILNGGKGYISAPTLSVYNTQNLGTGKYSNSSAILSPVMYQGSIVEVVVTDPGIGYPTDSDTYIVVSGDGTGANFSPVVYNGEVIDVVVENSGVGYRSISLSVVGSGSGAILRPVISSSELVSDQSTVEQLAIKGAIYSIVVTNEGTDYTNNTTINVIGDGTGCIANPVIENGKIKQIIVASYGSGYSYADVIIDDPARSIILDAIDAETYPILPSIGGHGSNAVSELFGSTVAINFSFREASFDDILLEYRQFGLLKNPTHINNGRMLVDSVYFIVYTTIFNNVIGLLKDDLLTYENVKFRVVSIEHGNIVKLQQIGTVVKKPLGLLTSDVFGEVPRSYTSTSVTSQPIANKYSGELLYASNETPFSFTENQDITIKTFLTF